MKKILTRVGSFTKSSFGAIILTISAITIIWHGAVWWRGIAMKGYVHAVLFLIDIIFAFALSCLLTYFFAQFVLPIQNQSDRKEIYRRVRDFSFDNRGPAIFIKNGRVIEHEGERNKKGLGVVVLDTASAAVLQTDIEYTDTVGPGVKFTKVHKINNENFHEYVAGSIDLRTQWKFIGPTENDQPFLNPPLYPNPAEYIKSQKRRQQTSGWTRDGFEVSPTIGIKFRAMRVTNTRTESGVTTHYGYDPIYVRKAIIHKPVVLDKENDLKDLMKWDELPVHLAINLWREYIRKFKLEELFTSNDEVSKLQTIEDMINQRVQKAFAVSLNDMGDLLPGKFESPEYKQLLERGIEVIEIRIRNILFDTDIEKKMAEQWSGEWLKNERKKEELLNKREASKETSTRKNAIKGFAQISSTYFENVTHDDIYTTLQHLIEPIKDAVAAESRANTELHETTETLEAVWKWLITSKNKPPPK